jgi:hypothetical protein
VRGRQVLLVDDILESGRTLAFAKDLLAARGAREGQSSVVLLEKPGKRAVNIVADFMSASNAPTISSSAMAWMLPIPTGNCLSSASSRPPTRPACRGSEPCRAFWWSMTRSRCGPWWRAA